jgi:hypothetical protein
LRLQAEASPQFFLENLALTANQIFLIATC